MFGSRKLFNLSGQRESNYINYSEKCSINYEAPNQFLFLLIVLIFLWYIGILIRLAVDRIHSQSGTLSRGKGLEDESPFDSFSRGE